MCCSYQLLKVKRPVMQLLCLGCEDCYGIRACAFTGGNVHLSFLECTQGNLNSLIVTIPDIVIEKTYLFWPVLFCFQIKEYPSEKLDAAGYVVSQGDSYVSY